MDLYIGFDAKNDDVLFAFWLIFGGVKRTGRISFWPYDFGSILNNFFERAGFRKPGSVKKDILNLGVDIGKADSFYKIYYLCRERVIPNSDFTALMKNLNESFRGFSDIRLATVLGGLITSILFATFLFLQWVSSGHSQLSLIIKCAISAVFINSIFGGWLLKRKIISLNKKFKPEWKRIFSIAMPLLATNITLFMVNYVDLWVLGIHSSQDEVAIYGAVSRLVAIIALPLIIVNSVVPPVIAGMYVQKKNERLENILRVSAGLATIPAILTVFCFILFGETILSVMFGNYYSQGLITLVFLSVGRLANVWAGSCGLTLILTGHQKSMMAITFFSATLLVMTASLVAGKYGANGVALASCVTMIIQNLLMLIFSRIQIGIWTHASFNPSLIKNVVHKTISSPNE